MASSTGNIVVALVAGVAVGVGLGILLAPDKGSKTRKKIKDGLGSTKEDLLEKLNGFLEGIQTVGEDVASNFEEILEKTTPKDKEDKEALISMLEQKLEALKNQK